MARRKRLIYGGAALVAVGALALWGRKASAAEDEDDVLVDPPPEQGPGGAGKVFRDPDDTGSPDFADFDFSGNGIYVSPECSFVIEGDLFRPRGDWVSAIEPPEYAGYVTGKELEAVIAVAADNSVAGFIDFFLDAAVPEGGDPGVVVGLTEVPPAVEEWFYERISAMGIIETPDTIKALAISWELLRQASPFCASVSPYDWGRGLQAWFVNFVTFVADYIFYWGDGVDFDPDAPAEDAPGV